MIRKTCQTRSLEVKNRQKIFIYESQNKIRKIFAKFLKFFNYLDLSYDAKSHLIRRIKSTFVFWGTWRNIFLRYVNWLKNILHLSATIFMELNKNISRKTFIILKKIRRDSKILLFISFHSKNPLKREKRPPRLLPPSWPPPRFTRTFCPFERYFIIEQAPVSLTPKRGFI